MAPKRQVARKSCGGWAPKKALATRQPRRKRSNGGWGTGIESLSRESEAPADQCQMMEVSDDPLTADILFSGMKAMQGILKQRLKEATEKERLAYEANLAKKNAELASLRKDKEQELASKDAQLACLSKESEKIRIQFEADWDSVCQTMEEELEKNERKYNEQMKKERLGFEAKLAEKMAELQLPLDRDREQDRIR